MGNMLQELGGDKQKRELEKGGDVLWAVEGDVRGEPKVTGRNPVGHT